MKITYHKSQNKKQNSDSGVVLLFSIFLVGFLISVVLTLSAIFIPKIKLAGGTKNSIAALYAAESGVEWCLRIYRLDPAGLTPKPVMANGATYTDKNGDVLSVADCQSSPIKVIGNNRGVTRSYEITL